MAPSCTKDMDFADKHDMNVEFLEHQEFAYSACIASETLAERGIRQIQSSPLNTEGVTTVVTTSVEMTRLAQLQEKLQRQFDQVPLIRKLHPRAIAIISLLVLVNLVVWAAAGIVLVR